MAVAGHLVEELLVRQGEEGAAAIRLEIDRDLRFPLRRRPPCPTEHQLPVGHDLAIDAAHVVLAAVIAAKADMEAAAHPDIGLGSAGRRIGRAPPADHFFRDGPGFVDFLGRGVEAALEGEAGLAGHFSSSSRKAARRSRSMRPAAATASSGATTAPGAGWPA